MSNFKVFSMQDGQPAGWPDKYDYVTYTDQPDRFGVPVIYANTFSFKHIPVWREGKRDTDHSIP